MHLFSFRTGCNNEASGLGTPLILFHNRYNKYCSLFIPPFSCFDIKILSKFYANFVRLDSHANFSSLPKNQHKKSAKILANAYFWALYAGLCCTSLIIARIVNYSLRGTYHVLIKQLIKYTGISHSTLLTFSNRGSFGL